MDEIQEPNADFKFDDLVLCPPSIVAGGNYFIKFKMNDEPLYIQCPKCTTRQGIVKAGKKHFCDILMSNESFEFIQWIENMETYCQDVIYKNREKWFEAGLEKHDIENSFLSSLKTYKSGKFYILRTNVPTRLGNCILKIYDEEEKSVDIGDIKDTSQIISILEVQGIKCSARSFQIEFEIKQMMVLKPSNRFERCVIKNKHAVEDNDSDEPAISSEPTNTLEIVSDKEKEETKPTVLEEHEPEPIETIKPTSKKESTKTHDEIEVFDFDLAEIPETEKVQLKNRKDVYYQMYRDAMKNAKIAKDLALSSYMEAKRIKNTYMLSDLDESDESDFEDSISPTDV
jgi:hypothetical protein